jgi:hypothetical protein
MKFVLKILFSVLIALLVFSCSADLKSLDSLTGKYTAYKDNNDARNQPLPYGIQINKSGTEFTIAVWTDTFSGEEVIGTETISVSGNKFVAGNGELIKSFEIQGEKIICELADNLYEKLRIGPALETWKCEKFNTDDIKIFDVTMEDASIRLDKFVQLNSDISRERGIFTYSRIEQTSEIEKIEEVKGNTIIELKKLANIVIIIESPVIADELKVGDIIKFRGRIYNVVLPFVKEDPVKFFMEDAIIVK